MRHFIPTISVGAEIPVQGAAGEVRLRVGEVIRHLCDVMGVTIVNEELSSDHVHGQELGTTSRLYT